MGTSVILSPLIPASLRDRESHLNPPKKLTFLQWLSQVETDYKSRKIEFRRVDDQIFRIRAEGKPTVYSTLEDLRKLYIVEYLSFFD